MKNQTKYYISQVLYGIILLTASGMLVQTFLLEKGISERYVAIYNAIMQAAQVIVMLIFSERADKYKNVIKLNAYVFLMFIPLALALLFFSLFKIENAPLIYGVLAVLGIISSICLGINNIVSYKVPYNIIDMKDYGKLIAVSGLVSGVVCALISFFISLMQSKISFFTVMIIVYVFTLFIIGAFVLVTRSFKKEYSPEIKDESVNISIFKYKPFYMLIIPNLFRGIVLGAVGMAVTIGYAVDLIDGKGATILMIITNVMTVLGSVIYSKICNVIGDKYVLLASSIMIFLSLPLMVMGNTMLFFVAYGVLYLFVIIVNYSVPVTVTKLVDYKVIGKYSGYRMLVNTLGITVAGVVCVPMIEYVGALWAMTILGALQLLFGVGYYLYITFERRLNNENII